MRYSLLCSHEMNISLVRHLLIQHKNIAQNCFIKKSLFYIMIAVYVHYLSYAVCISHYSQKNSKVIGGS